MGADIDLHIGKRLRRRRRLLGLTQQQVAEVVGIRFQQIQKYECGANRISAARLWELADTLNVPISYFYDGLNGAAARLERETAEDLRTREAQAHKDTQDLLHAYCQLSERPRRRLLDIAKSLNNETCS